MTYWFEVQDIIFHVRTVLYRMLSIICISYNIFK